MPRLRTTSYLELIDRFLSVWEDVNDALAPGSLVVSGFGLPELQAARASLAQKMTLIQQRDNVVQGLRAERDDLKRSILPRFIQFRHMVLAMMPDSSYAATLKRSPARIASPDSWFKAMDVFAHDWEQINTDPPAGFAPPLMLPGPYDLAQFQADCAQLRTTFTELSNAEMDASQARRERDLEWRTVVSKLVLMRHAVKGLFPSGHPLISSLPKLQKTYPRKKADRD